MFLAEEPQNTSETILGIDRRTKTMIQLTAEYVSSIARMEDIFVAMNKD